MGNGTDALEFETEIEDMKEFGTVGSRNSPPPTKSAESLRGEISESRRQSSSSLIPAAAAPDGIDALGLGLELEILKKEKPRVRVRGGMEFVFNSSKLVVMEMVMMVARRKVLLCFHRTKFCSLLLLASLKR